MTRPSQHTFEKAGQDVRLPVALAGLVLTYALHPAIRALQSVWSGVTLPGESFAGLLWPFLMSLAGFAVFCFLLHIAGLVVSDGRARFRDYVHFLALAWAPPSLLNFVLYPIPGLPSWTALGMVGLYQVILTVQALRAIHGFTVPRALTIILGSALVWFALFSLVVGPFIAATAVREAFYVAIRPIRRSLGLTETPGMMTLEEARRAVDFPVLATTELPAGYELESVRVMSTLGLWGKTVIVKYRSGSETLSIQQSPASPDGRPPPGAQVTVRGRPAVLREMDFGRMLVWKEEGVLISMFDSGGLSAESLLAVAESLR